MHKGFVEIRVVRLGGQPSELLFNLPACARGNFSRLLLLRRQSALRPTGKTRVGIASAVPIPTRVNATSIRFSTAAVVEESPSPGVVLSNSKRFIRPFAARLPGIIGMQPTTASTDPRGESGCSNIRLKTARRKAAINEAAGRPKPPIVLSPGAHRQRKRPGPEAKPQQARRAIEKDAKAGSGYATEKRLMEKVKNEWVHDCGTNRC